MIIHHNQLHLGRNGFIWLTGSVHCQGKTRKELKQRPWLAQSSCLYHQLPRDGHCSQQVRSSFISISNQENAPADLSTSNSMEVCSSLRLFFPDNFYLCWVDKETHQDSKGGCSEGMKQPETFLHLLRKIISRKTSADVESSRCH